ncbi:Hypothetical predicted protein, partial [Pelobates cultripes]
HSSQYCYSEIRDSQVDQRVVNGMSELSVFKSYYNDCDVQDQRNSTKYCHNDSQDSITNPWHENLDSLCISS